RGGRRRLGGVTGALLRVGIVASTVREGDRGDEEHHHADHRDEAARRRTAASARAAVRVAASFGQAGAGPARVVSETHAAYAPSASCGYTSYSGYSTYDGSRAGCRSGAVW